MMLFALAHSEAHIYYMTVYVVMYHSVFCFVLFLWPVGPYTRQGLHMFCLLPGNQILVGDIMRSVTLIQFDPEERANRWICMLKFHPKRAREKVWTCVKESQFKQVSGCGCSPEMSRKLFKRFASCGTCRNRKTYVQQMDRLKMILQIYKSLFVILRSMNIHD